MEDTNYVRSNTWTTISLETIGMIVWVVFMVLWYGTGVLNPTNFHIFWVWFPLWFPIALDFAVIILVLLITGIVLIIQARLE